MKTIKGDLVMEKNMTFNEDLVVEGNIFGKNRSKFNLKVFGDLDCFDLNCRNLDCNNLNCWNLDGNNLDCLNLNGNNLNCLDLDCNNLNCLNLNCNNLNCLNLDCNNLNCNNLIFYATAIAYNSFKCKTWKARRRNYIIRCLDEKIRGEQKK